METPEKEKMTEDKPKNKKNHSKARLFWIIAIIIVAIAVFSPKSTPQQQTASTQATASADTKANDPQPAQAKPTQPSVPAEYTSALAKADSYANTMNMSKQGVYDQLTSQYGERFAPAAAQYAVDNVRADWNANALAKAKSYQSMQNMSPAAIHDQLVSQDGEKFTPTEADYAIQHLNG